MSSPCTRSMLFLKKKNQDLLAQLESNAAVLDARLKKLRDTARTPRRSDKSWRNLSQGSLKRKYDSWKARNNSGQVSSALHPVQSPADKSSDSQQKPNYRTCTKNADLTDVRKPTLHDSKVTTKECRTTLTARKPTISSMKRQSPSKPYSKTDCHKVNKSPVKVVSKCYCKTSCKNTNSKTNVSPGQICGKCSRKDFSDSKVLLPVESLDVLNSQRRTLEEARTVISYSPESMFLRRLKTRSQISLNAVDPPKPSAQSKRTTNHRTVNPVKKSLSPKLESPNARKSPRLCQKPVASSPTKQPRKPASSKPQNHKIDVSKKENINCCSKYVQTSGLDVVAGLVDNEHKAKRLIGENGEGWVDELSEFRRSHWFDCHSHATNDEQVKHPEMDNECLLGPSKLDCNCVHRYILNDRLFPVPLNPDHNNQSRCMRCNIPAGSKTKQAPKYPREITLDTARSREQAQVTLPKHQLSIPRDVKPSVGGFKILTSLDDPVKGGLTSGSKSTTFKQLKPMNSFALRYQKGMM